MAALQEEKCSLMSENEIMNDRLDQLDGSFDDTNTAVAKKYFHAQLQIEQLQEENFRYDLMSPSHFLLSLLHLELFTETK